MSIIVPSVYYDAANKLIIKYIRSLKSSEDELEASDLFNLEMLFREELERLTKGDEPNYVLGGGSYGLVFDHVDTNLVCKIGKFNDLYTEVSNWLYLSNLISRGLVQAIEIGRFMMLPFMEDARLVLDSLSPVYGVKDATAKHFNNPKVKKLLNEIQKIFELIDTEYDDGNYMALLIEDRMDVTVQNFARSGNLLDDSFLFEFLYFEYICWKYLNVYMINDSKADNLTVVTIKKPTIYKIGDTLFRFDKGLGFRRIDFGALFSTALNSPIISEPGFKLLLKDDDLLENTKLQKADKVFKMEYTFPGFTKETLSTYSFWMLEPDLFDKKQTREFVKSIKSKGISLAAFEDVAKVHFKEYIIQSLPKDSDSFIFIDSTQFSKTNQKRKMEERSNEKQKVTKTEVPEEIMKGINQTHEIISSRLNPRKLGNKYKIKTL
jgi:hypothetical protein